MRCGRWVVATAVIVVACHSSAPHSLDSSVAADAPPGDAPLPPCVPFDIMVQPVSILGRPIWIGSEWLLLVQSRPATMQRISADGTLGPTFMLGGDVNLYSWALAWTGAELGLLFSTDAGNGTQSYTLARYTGDGTPIAMSPVASGVPNLLDFRTLRWAGDRYLVGWIDMGSTPTATVEEVSADGVVGAVHTVSNYGNWLKGLASNATTYMAAIGSYGIAGPVTFVAIDRATGTVSHHDAPYGVDGVQLLARDHDFVTYGPLALRSDGTNGPALESLDATGSATTNFPVPSLEVPDVVSTSYGYHLAGSTQDAMTTAITIQDVNIGSDGTPLGPVSTRAMFTQNGSFYGPAVGSRGNGLLTVWASGPNGAMTVRAIQDCIP